jgi:formate dehydrogenase maturation protein FdhE
MAQREWDRRIRRANELTSSYPFASEGLRFYSRVATFQRSLYVDIQQALADSPAGEFTGSLRDELDLFLLLPNFSRFLALIEQLAPARLAQAAVGLARKGTAGWQRAIEDFWHGDLDTALAVGGMDEEWEGTTSATQPREQLLAWIFLQPYAEYLADQRENTIVDGAPSTCPLCGGRPIVGVLRSEGDGAKQSLMCM